jgi:aminobenzoyl-glutamate transport protein
VNEPGGARRGWLDRVERIGNALPDPTTLFALGALAVAVLSQVAAGLDWSVEKSVPATDAAGAAIGGLARVEVRAVPLLSSDGVYWMLQSMVKSFVEFPPLGVVLVGMLGIGLAERTGFIGALLKAVLLAVPARWLAPTLVFVGVMSSMGMDAGYVVLPPVAAALYAAVGRSPLVGIAAVFAGVAGGFSANLFLTSLDPLVAGLSTESARLIDPDYAVAATANYWFMVASTFLLTGVGWAVTAWWVEPRFANKPPEEGGAPDASAAEGTAHRLAPEERRALSLAAAAAGAAFLLMLAATWIPGAPLHGSDGRFPRWVTAIVPLIFLGFLVPGAVSGIASGSLRSDKDAARMLGETMAGMGPYLAMAFFAAQFIAYFSHSKLGEMLALAGGQALAHAQLPTAVLIVAFVGVVMLADLFIGSLSAKFAFMAPVFVPMFMQVGVSPELTQAAYRVGDSVVNTITPLNPYMVIVLALAQRWVPRAGVGTLVALMVPYALAFAVAWTVLLLAWMATGFDLGPAGPLVYTP